MRRADKELNKKAAESIAAGMKLTPEELVKVLEDDPFPIVNLYSCPLDVLMAEVKRRGIDNGADIRLAIEALHCILIQLYEAGTFNSYSQMQLKSAREILQKIQSLTGV